MTESELPEAPSVWPDLEEIPFVKDFEVWVRIKKSSEYYHQGLSDPCNAKSKPKFFKLSYFTPLTRLQKGGSTALYRDGFTLHFNNNTYRIEDVELFLRDATDAKNFVRIV